MNLILVLLIGAAIGALGAAGIFFEPREPYDEPSAERSLELRRVVFAQAQRGCAKTVAFWCRLCGEAAMRRLTGYLLIGIGIVHTVYGVLKGWGRLVEIAQAGFFRAIEPHLPRRVLFWFLFAGFFMILLGHLCLWVERRLGQRIPAFLGWELVVLSALGAILIPAPGFFLLLGIGIYVVAAARGGTPTGETVR